MYEKRKAAALEIEKMVKDFVSVGNTSQIKKLLKVPQQIQLLENQNSKKILFSLGLSMMQVLGSEFAISQNPHMRKGGLIGLCMNSTL